MLVTFQSEAYADVVMFGDVARRMMEILGKEPAVMGVVTVDELPTAIEKLKAAIGADVRPARQTAEDGADESFVSVTQRALPLLELFEHSLKREVPVLWVS